MSEALKLLMMKLRNPSVELVQEEEQQVKRDMTFTCVVLGKLFLQNYRTLSKSEETIILYRRVNHITNYLFVMLEAPGARLDPKESCKKCMETIRKFSPDRPNSISLLFVHLCSFSTSAFTSNAMESIQLETFKPSPTIERDFSMQSTAQFKALKKIINDYIDRVGQFKESLVQETINARKFMLSFDLRLLLQTVNKIVAEECLINNCTQIESQEWSVFNPYNRVWQGQRRDTLMKNGGNLIIIDWLFLQDFEKYLTEEYLLQANDVIGSYQQGYAQARLKLYCIGNQLDDSTIHYRYKSKSLGRSEIYGQLEKIEAKKNKGRHKEPEIIEISE